MKKTFISILFALIALFAICTCTAFAGNTTIDEIDAAIETLRGGKSLPDEISLSDTDYFTATIDGWFILNDQTFEPIDNEYTLVCDEVVYLEATFTPDEGYSFSESVEAYINAEEGVLLSSEGNSLKYRFAMTVLDDKTFDMFAISVNPVHGYSSMDIDKIIQPITEHIIISDETRENGIEIVNLEDENDTSGVLEFPGNYKMTFSLKATDGYKFYYQGGVSVIGGGLYYIHPKAIYTYDEITGENIIVVEIGVFTLPVDEITEINVEYNPSENALFSDSLVCKTEHVSISNIKAVTVNDSTEISNIPDESYILDFDVQAEDGYVVADNVTVNLISSSIPETSVFNNSLNTKKTNCWFSEAEYGYSVSCRLTVPLVNDDPVEDPQKDIILIDYIELEFEPQKYSANYSSMLRCKTEHVKTKNIFVAYRGSSRTVTMLLTGKYNMTFDLETDSGYALSENCKIKLNIISMNTSVTFSYGPIRDYDTVTHCSLDFTLEFFDCIAWIFRQIGKWF